MTTIIFQCDIGDKLYEVVEKKVLNIIPIYSIREDMVTGQYYNNDMSNPCHEPNLSYKTLRIGLIPDKEIGKSVFKSREDAQMEIDRKKAEIKEAIKFWKGE